MFVVSDILISDYKTVSGMECFLSEIQLASQLSHENIHKTIGFTVLNNIPYSITEDIKGQRLRGHVRDKSRVICFTVYFLNFGLNQ